MPLSHLQRVGHADPDGAGAVTAGDTQSLKYSIFGQDYTAIRSFHNDPLTSLIHGGRYYVVIELM